MPKTELRPSETANHGIFNRSISLHRAQVLRALPTQKPAEQIDVWDILVPITPQLSIPARIYVPKNRVFDKLHTIFYIPGTAFVASEVDFTHTLCSHLCEKTQQKIVVFYPRLAPENKYPTGHLDCFNAFESIINSHLFNIDINKVSFMGYCSGANFAIQVAFLAKEKGLPIKHLILMSPYVDLSRRPNPYQFIQDQDSTVSEEFVLWCTKMYVPPDREGGDPGISPLWLEPLLFEGLAERVDMVVATKDRFFGDTLRLWLLLEQAKIFCTLELLEGDHSYAWHDLRFIEHLARVMSDVTAITPQVFSQPTALAGITQPSKATFFSNESADSVSEELLPTTSKIRAKL